MQAGLASPLVPMHVDPVHRPAGRVLPAASCGYRLAAIGLQEARQPLLHGFRIPIVTDDLTGVVDADDQEPAVAVSERTQRPAEAAKVSELTLELGPRVLTAFDASLNVSPFHGPVSQLYSGSASDTSDPGSRFEPPAIGTTMYCRPSCM